MKMKMPLLLLLLSCLVAAGTAPVPTGTATTAPSSGLMGLVNMAIALIVPAMMVLIALAAAAYAIGQMFGAETQARATMWAKSMLAAVAVAAVLLAVLFIFMPNFMLASNLDILGFLQQTLVPLAQTALSVLIVLLVVLAAAVYALGQIGGAETRARATVWATGMLAAALLCSVLYVLISQVFAQLQVVLFQGSVLAPYGAVIINTAFFVSAVILVTYLVSRVFGIPEWEAYLSIELTNLMGSFLVLLFVLGFFAVSAGFTTLVVGQVSAPQAALAFLRETVANNVLIGMKDIFTIQTCTSMLSTFNKRIGEAALTNVIKVFPGTDVFVSITNVLGYGFVAIYGSLSTQITAMNLVDATMFNFVLPAGLVLRFFPPTRDAGSFLIAFAFGFQFVFPLIYIINGLVLQDIGAPTYDKAKSNLIISAVCQVGTYGAAGFFFNPRLTNSLPSFLPGIGGALKILLSEPLLNLVPMVAFLPVMQSLALLSLYGLFIPAFALVITIAFINAMTKFLTQKV